MVYGSWYPYCYCILDLAGCVLLFGPVIYLSYNHLFNNYIHFFTYTYLFLLDRYLFHISTASKYTYKNLQVHAFILYSLCCNRYLHVSTMYFNSPCPTQNRLIFLFLNPKVHLTILTKILFVQNKYLKPICNFKKSVE